jgi:hypothetical protein
MHHVNGNDTNGANFQLDHRTASCRQSLNQLPTLYNSSSRRGWRDRATSKQWAAVVREIRFAIVAKKKRAAVAESSFSFANTSICIRADHHAERVLLTLLQNSQQIETQPTRSSEWATKSAQ